MALVKLPRMKPIYILSLLLLAFTLCLAVVGLVLARYKKIHVRNAANYCRCATGLVLLIAYSAQHYELTGVPLHQLDFWSLMVILAISCYAVLWASIAFVLNRNGRHGFEESELLSMLHADSQHGVLDASVAKKVARQ